MSSRVIWTLVWSVLTLGCTYSAVGYYREWPMWGYLAMAAICVACLVDENRPKAGRD